MQRTIINGINAVEPLKGMLRELKAAVKGVNMSHSQRAYLKSAQERVGVTPAQLIQSNATRCVISTQASLG